MINHYRDEVLRATEIPLKPNLIDWGNTAILVVDMLNDGCREEGFFYKHFHFDIELFKEVEKNLFKFLSVIRKYSIKIFFTVTFYDFEYIPFLLKENFSKMPLPPNVSFDLALKGTWGSQIVDSLIDFADGLIVKSHYSAFSPNYSFFYLKGLSEYLEIYLSYTVEQDYRLTKEKKKILKDFYKEGYNSFSIEIDKGLIINNLKNDIVCNLDVYLRANNINTLIIVGGSTHVCLDATVSAASERGYKIILPIDCIASEDYLKHWVYLHNHMIFKASVTNSTKLMEILR